MQIKTFTAKSTKAVLAMIKQELGPDAVILDTEESNGTITMTAALERASTPFVAPPPPPFDGLPDGLTDSLTGALSGDLYGGRADRYTGSFAGSSGHAAPRPGMERDETGAGVAQSVFASLQNENGGWGDFADKGRNEVFSRSGERPFTPASRDNAEREERGEDAGQLYSPRGRLRKEVSPDSRIELSQTRQGAESRSDRNADRVADRGQGREQAGAPDRSGSRNGRARASDHDMVEQAAAPASRQSRPRAASVNAAAFAGEQSAPGFGAPPEGWRQWQDEWNSIKNHILALMKPALRLDKLPPRQRLAIEFLQREGVNDGAVLHLFRELSENPDSSILQPLAGMVPVKPWSDASWPEKIQLVCGPFGAGKTTVSIRMALALRRMAPAFRICLVNADATRGNGRLLLRHYCDLSDFSYKEASNTLELVGALNEALREGFDRVLVDLPGLSRGRFLASLVSDAGLANMAGDMGIAVHLALDPHFGDLQMQGIIDRYRTPLRGSLVWTKLDEAGHFGQLVNMGMASGLPVSALSFGPGLGNSLVPAEANMLWRLLFKRELPVAQ